MSRCPARAPPICWKSFRRGGHQVRVGIVDGPRGIATVRTIGDEMVAYAASSRPKSHRVPNVDLLLAVPAEVLRRSGPDCPRSGRADHPDNAKRWSALLRHPHPRAGDLPAAADRGLGAGARHPLASCRSPSVQGVDRGSAGRAGQSDFVWLPIRRGDAADRRRTVKRRGGGCSGDRTGGGWNAFELDCSRRRLSAAAWPAHCAPHRMRRAPLARSRHGPAKAGHYRNTVGPGRRRSCWFGSVRLYRNSPW